MTNYRVKELLISAVTATMILAGCSSPAEDKIPPVKVETGKTTLPTSMRIKRSGEMNGNRFFLNEKNEPMFDKAIFYNAHEFHKGYCIVSKMIGGKELRGVIDSTGKVVIDFTHEEYLGDINEGFIEVKTVKNPLVGYMNLKGEMVIPCEYTDSKGFSNGMVKLANKERKWGVLNQTGQIIIPFEYEKIGPWRDDLSIVRKNSKWGCINTKGETIIPFEYNSINNFSMGVTLVEKGKKFALVNSKNELLTDFVFDDCKEVVDVQKDPYSSTGYSESNERVVLEEGVLILSKNKKWGLLDIKGETILPFEYSFVGIPDRAGLVSIEKDGKKQLFDIKTKKIK
ncbi:MAG: WG repeat-containing protein [Bacteroidia bacterium]